MLKRALFGGDGGGSPVADFGLMILRVGIGAFIACGHGRFKIPPTEQFIGGVTQMGMPAPTVFAWLAAFCEFGGGLLLVLGLFTRPAALMVVGVMVVAITGVHLKDPMFIQQSPTEFTFKAKELALLYLVPALGLLFTGAGRFGIDALIRRPMPRSRSLA